ncbi:BnaA09g24590D [Brassica napus]|uniref:BnaA09g24590D protein n=1 Tax=Brassica napus TaxID=3708 RepID=A0A078FGX6_BRANA|nr:BnaA09g24590D [Brassica napus]
MANWTRLIQLAVGQVGHDASNSPNGELDWTWASWVSPTPCIVVSGTLNGDLDLANPICPMAGRTMLTIAKIVMSLEKYNNPVKHLKIIKGHIQSSKNSSTYVGGNSETLPIDLIIEILKRLPAKAIALCRCVSKEWDSILCSPHFAKSFLTSSSTRPQLLFTFEFKGKWHFFSSPQLHFNENISVVAPDYHMGVSGDWYKEVCLSTNGFVYLYEKQMLKGKMERVPVLCNPSTGQKIPLPKVRAKNNELRSFLGYDPIEKQFKFLCMTWHWKKPFYVYFYNVERKSVRRVEIQGIEEKVFMDPAAHHGEVFTFPNHVENLMFRQ